MFFPWFLFSLYFRECVKALCCLFSRLLCWCDQRSWELVYTDQACRGIEVRKGCAMGTIGDVCKGKEGFSWCSVAGLGTRLGDWIWSYLTCFSLLLRLCVPREYLLVLEAGIKRWFGRSKVAGRRSLCSIRGGVKEEREITVRFPLQWWEWDWGRRLGSQEQRECYESNFSSLVSQEEMPFG